MKPAFFIFALFATASMDSFAALDRVPLSVEGQVRTFVDFKERGLKISEDCVLREALRNCDARLALDKADLSKLSADPFGRNPGAMLCSRQLGGRVAWSRDAAGNERTFCRFADGSLIAASSLARAGSKK